MSTNHGAANAIARFKEKAEELSTRMRTRASIVRALKDDMDQLAGKGVSIADMAEILSTAGVPIDAVYLSQIFRGDYKSVSSKRKSNLAPNQLSNMLESLKQQVAVLSREGITNTVAVASLREDIDRLSTFGVKHSLFVEIFNDAGFKFNAKQLKTLLWRARKRSGTSHVQVASVIPGNGELAVSVILEKPIHDALLRITERINSISGDGMMLGISDVLAMLGEAAAAIERAPESDEAMAARDLLGLP